MAFAAAIAAALLASLDWAVSISCWRDQFRVLLIHLLQARVDQVRIGVIRFRLLLLGLGVVELVSQFRHFKRRQYLALLDLVAKSTFISDT